MWKLAVLCELGPNILLPESLLSPSNRHLKCPPVRKSSHKIYENLRSPVSPHDIPFIISQPLSFLLSGRKSLKYTTTTLSNLHPMKKCLRKNRPLSTRRSTRRCLRRNRHLSIRKISQTNRCGHCGRRCISSSTMDLKLLSLSSKGIRVRSG